VDHRGGKTGAGGAGVGADGHEEKPCRSGGSARGVEQGSWRWKPGGLIFGGHLVAPHWREATGDRPAEVIHRLGWPQRWGRSAGAGYSSSELISALASQRRHTVQARHRTIEGHRPVS
jgi:hypothetical protein